MEVSEIPVAEITEINGNKSALTGLDEVLLGSGLVLIGQRLLESRKITEMFEHSIVFGGERGGGRVRLRLPPVVAGPLPSLLLVSKGQEKQAADESGGGKPGGG